MAIILLIADRRHSCSSLSVATLVQVARDGYHPVPTRPELLRHP